MIMVKLPGHKCILTCEVSLQHASLHYKAALNYTHTHFTYSLPIQMECLTEDHGVEVLCKSYSSECHGRKEGAHSVEEGGSTFSALQ